MTGINIDKIENVREMYDKLTERNKAIIDSLVMSIYTATLMVIASQANDKKGE